MRCCKMTRTPFDIPWQVARTRQLQIDMDGETGNTHTPLNEILCWHRQQYVASVTMKVRA